MNEASFEELYAAHSHRILGFFLRRVEPSEDAADLVTEVFTIAWRRIAAVPEGEAAKLWLYGVARKVLATTCAGPSGGTGWPKDSASIWRRPEATTAGPTYARPCPVSLRRTGRSSPSAPGKDSALLK